MSRITRVLACTTLLLAMACSTLGVAVENIPHSGNPNDVSHIIAPLSGVLLHDKLHTTIRAATQHLKHPPSPPSSPTDVDGKFVGRYEQGTVGSGKYTGTFRGTVSPKHARVNFAYSVDGAFKFMDADLMYSASISGLTTVKNAKHVSVTAEYESNKVDGTIHGKKITDAKCRGIVKLHASGNRLYGMDAGRFAITVDGKRLTANYKLLLHRNTVRLAMYGMYAGEKFFVNHAASLNIIKLGLQMNPAIVTRNYGTVTGTAAGKKFTHKYDMSGMPMLNFTK